MQLWTHSDVTWAQQMKTTDRVSRKADDTITSTER